MLYAQHYKTYFSMPLNTDMTLFLLNLGSDLVQVQQREERNPNGIKMKSSLFVILCLHTGDSHG